MVHGVSDFFCDTESGAIKVNASNSHELKHEKDEVLEQKQRGHASKYSVNWNMSKEEVTACLYKD